MSYSHSFCTVSIFFFRPIDYWSDSFDEGSYSIPLCTVYITNFFKGTVSREKCIILSYEVWLCWVPLGASCSLSSLYQDCCFWGQLFSLSSWGCLPALELAVLSVLYLRVAAFGVQLFSWGQAVLFVLLGLLTCIGASCSLCPLSQGCCLWGPAVLSVCYLCGQAVLFSFLGLLTCISQLFSLSSIPGFWPLGASCSLFPLYQVHCLWGPAVLSFLYSISSLLPLEANCSLFPLYQVHCLWGPAVLLSFLCLSTAHSARCWVPSLPLTTFEEGRAGLRYSLPSG